MMIRSLPRLKYGLEIEAINQKCFFDIQEAFDRLFPLELDRMWRTILHLGFDAPYLIPLGITQSLV